MPDLPDAAILLLLSTALAIPGAYLASRSSNRAAKAELLTATEGAIGKHLARLEKEIQRLDTQVSGLLELAEQQSAQIRNQAEQLGTQADRLRKQDGQITALTAALDRAIQSEGRLVRIVRKVLTALRTYEPETVDRIRVENPDLDPLK